MVLTVLKNIVFQLRIFSIKLCDCSPSICCNFHGDKEQALFSEPTCVFSLYAICIEGENCIGFNFFPPISVVSVLL